MKHVTRLLVKQLLSAARRFDAQPELKGLLYVNPAAKKNSALLNYVLPGERHMYWPLHDSLLSILKRELRSEQPHVSESQRIAKGFQVLKLLNDRAAFAKLVGMISPLEDARSTRFHTGTSKTVARGPKSAPPPNSPLMRVGRSPAPGTLLVSHPMHARDSRHRKVVLLLEHDSRGNSKQGSLGVALNADQLAGYLKGDWFVRSAASSVGASSTSGSSDTPDAPTRGGAYHAPMHPPAWQMGPGTSVSHNSLNDDDFDNKAEDSSPLDPPLAPRVSQSDPPPQNDVEGALEQAGPPAFWGGPMQVPVFFIHTRADVGGTALSRPWWSAEQLAHSAAAGGRPDPPATATEGGGANACEDEAAQDCAGQPVAAACSAFPVPTPEQWAHAVAAGHEIYTNGDKDTIQDRVDAGEWDPQGPSDGAAFFSSVFSWRIGALREELQRGEWLVVEHSDPWSLVQEHVLGRDTQHLHKDLQLASSSDWRSGAWTRAAAQEGAEGGGFDSVEGGGDDAIWQQVLQSLGGEYAALARMPDSFLALHPAAPEEYRPDPEVAFRQQLEWEASLGGEGGAGSTGDGFPFGDDNVQLTEVAPGVFIAVHEGDEGEQGGSDDSGSDDEDGDGSFNASALTRQGGEDGQHRLAESLQELIRRQRAAAQRRGEAQNGDSSSSDSDSSSSSSSSSSSDSSSSDSDSDSDNERR